MPKELLEIKGFHKGIDSSTSAEDIDQDSAAHSQNIDCTARDGALVGIPDNSTTLMTSFNTEAITSTPVSAVSRVDNTVITFHEDGSVYKGDDNSFEFETAGSLGENATPSCFEPHNRELHVGMGASPPKWAGYKKNNVTDQYEFQVGDAELAKPGGDNFNNSFTKILRHPDDTGYAYAYNRGTTFIYRIRLSDGFVERSLPLKNLVQDICPNVSDSGTNITFLMFIRGGDVETSIGSIQRLDMSGFDSAQALELAEPPRDMGYAENNIPNFTGGSYSFGDMLDITDIVETGAADNGVIWFHITHEGSGFDFMDHGIRPVFKPEHSVNRFLFACPNTYVNSNWSTLDSFTDQSISLNYIKVFDTVKYSSSDWDDYADWNYYFGITDNNSDYGYKIKNMDTIYSDTQSYDYEHGDTLSTKTWNGVAGWERTKPTTPHIDFKVRIKSLRNTLVVMDGAANKIGYAINARGYDEDDTTYYEAASLITMIKLKMEPAHNHAVTTSAYEVGPAFIEHTYNPNGLCSTDLTIEDGGVVNPGTDLSYTITSAWGKAHLNIAPSLTQIIKLPDFGTTKSLLTFTSHAKSKVFIEQFDDADDDFAGLTHYANFNYMEDLDDADNNILFPNVVHSAENSDSQANSHTMLVFDKTGNMKIIKHIYDLDTPASAFLSTSVFLSYSESSIELSVHLPHVAYDHDDDAATPNEVPFSEQTFPAVTSPSDEKARFYRTSITYDGYQESPLSLGTWDTSSVDYSNATNGAKSLNIKISLDATKINTDRISHVTVYRADSYNYPYRIVKKLSFSRDFKIDTAEEFYTTYLVDRLTQGATYEAITGLPESIERSIVRYTCATQINSTMIVGGCRHPEDDDEDFSRYIFKSKENRFDTFDWTTDFCVLPEEPIAISNYKGRVYAFSKNSMYRINPNGLYIEDTSEGIGCINKDCITTTDYGMFWADHKNIYLLTSQGMTPIGMSIIKGGSNFNADWSSYWHKMNEENPNYKFKAVFDPSRLSFMLLGVDSFTATEDNISVTRYKGAAWAYHVMKKRWDLIEYPTNSRETNDDSIHDYADVVQLQDNTLAFFRTSSDGLHFIDRYMQGDSRLPWTWISKDMTMGMDSQDKFLYKVKATYAGTQPKVYYWVNTSRSSSVDAEGAAIEDTGDTVTDADSTGLFNAKITKRRARSIQVQLASDGSDTEVKSAGIVYRRRSIR